MATRRIVNAKDVVKRDQEVYVKVISIANHKLSFSMRDVDQNTGQDLLPLKNNNNLTNPSTFKNRGSTGLSGIKIIDNDDAPLPSRRSLKRMSSLERWEAQQMIASGVLTGVLAMIQTEKVFNRCKDEQDQADQKRAKFFQPEGDHLTSLAVYEAWKAKSFSEPWCVENFVNCTSLRRAQDVRKQLLSLVDSC